MQNKASPMDNENFREPTDDNSSPLFLVAEGYSFRIHFPATLNSRAEESLCMKLANGNNLAPSKEPFESQPLSCCREQSCAFSSRKCTSCFARAFQKTAEDDQWNNGELIQRKISESFLVLYGWWIITSAHVRKPVFRYF